MNCLKARAVLSVVLVACCLQSAEGQDVIEQEYFEDARAKNAAIAAARYAEEGYYYTRFTTYTRAVDSSRVFADTALFFVGRSMMLGDTSIYYAKNEEEQAIDYLEKGKKNTKNADQLIRTFYPMKDIRAHHSYGINASLYLSNAVMNYFNASMLLEAEDGKKQPNPYEPMPYEDEVNRLEADEAAYVELNQSMHTKLAEADSTLTSLRNELAEATDPDERERIEKWIERVKAEQKYAKNRLGDTATRLESIRELLDKRYLEEVADLPEDRESASFETNRSRYYKKNKIDYDPELPDGLVYKIQLGYYPRQADKSEFYGLYPITGETVGNDYVLYYAGMFEHYRQASKGKEYVRENAVKDAFIVPFLNGEKVNVKRALEAEKKSYTK